MDFEWDDAKHAINLGKHGLDFVDANLLFESAFLLEPARKVGAELRELAIGRIQDRLVALIFTRRGDCIRVISLRAARHDERRRYQALFG